MRCLTELIILTCLLELVYKFLVIVPILLYLEFLDSSTSRTATKGEGHTAPPKIEYVHKRVKLFKIA